MKKILTATLKETIHTATQIDLDWENPLLAASMVEDFKRQSLVKIKALLHEKVATLSLDDCKFEVRPL